MPPLPPSFAHAIRPADKIFYLPMAMDPRPFAYQLTCSLRKKGKKRKKGGEHIARTRSPRRSSVERRVEGGRRIDRFVLLDEFETNSRIFPRNERRGQIQIVIFGVKFILFEESRYYIDISRNCGNAGSLSLSLLMTDHSTAPWYYNFIKSALARLPKTFVSIPRTFLRRWY